MKVNKFVKGFAAIALFSLVLAGCGADKKDNTTNSSSAASSETKKSTESSAPAKKVAGGDLKDGTYKLEEKNEKNGYRAVFEMTVKDGKITESKYDNINADGKSKTEDTKYEESMKAKSGVGPKEYIKQLNDSFVKAQSASGVEVVTGATHSSESFQNYAQQLIQAAQAGNTDTIEIDNGATLKDGKVTESNYDNVNADGKSKKDDTEYESKMKDVTGVGPKEYIETLNKEFVKAMGEEDGSPAGVEVVTGATHSTHSFINYAQQLVNAAEKGDTTEIVVDNIVTK